MSETGPSIEAVKYAGPPRPTETAASIDAHKKEGGMKGVIAGFFVLLAQERFRPVLEGLSAMKAQPGH